MHGTLAELPALEARDELKGPVMVLIGDAVAGGNFTRSEPLRGTIASLAPFERT
ncbi:hypothetical protein D3C72_2341740 [compost metagenome]